MSGPLSIPRRSRRALAAALALGLVSVQGLASPDVSPRPPPRPAGPVAAAEPGAPPPAPPAAFVLEAPLGSLAAPPAGAPPVAVEAVGVVAASIRPEVKPGDIAARARAARATVASPARAAQPDPSVRRATGAVGALCGSPAIVGEPLAPIPGRLRGCGVAEPVRVAAVAGVRLSRPSVMDCGTARALAGWIEQGVKPAVGTTGGGVAGLQVAAHYACRPRNNRPGAKISEHGRGRAIDIAAIVLADGRRITVLDGWRRRAEGRILRAVHAAACGPFGTVLGPDGDRYHQDHLHLDTTPRRTAYCR